MSTEWRQILEGEDGIETRHDRTPGRGLVTELEVRVTLAGDSPRFHADIRKALADYYGDDWEPAGEGTPEYDDEFIYVVTPWRRGASRSRRLRPAGSRAPPRRVRSRFGYRRSRGRDRSRRSPRRSPQW